MMEKTGQILDGTAFLYKTIAVYKASVMDGAPENIEISVVEDRDSKRSLVIHISQFPMIRLSSTYPDDNGLIFLNSLEYLGGNYHGWNEYSLQLLGTGRLTLGDTAVLENIREIEPVMITGGRIRRYDTRLTGNTALSALPNRRERITSLVSWMNSLDNPKAHSIDSFNSYWKPLLLPETVLRKHRPENWNMTEIIFIDPKTLTGIQGIQNVFFRRSFQKSETPVHYFGTGKKLFPGFILNINGIP